MTDREMLRSVMMQRDEMSRALSRLEDAINHGILNGMLGERSHRHPDVDPKAKCEKGLDRENVIWSCGNACISKGCDGIGKGCHVSFEELRLFKAMRKARKSMARKMAEMPDTSPGSFPKYDPEHLEYSVTPVGVARMIYRLAVGIMFYDRNDEDSAKAWREALDNTLCIAIGGMLGNGKGKSFRKFASASNETDSEEEAQKFLEDNPDILKDMHCILEYDPKDLDNFDKLDDYGKARILLADACRLRFEYQIGRQYPAGDMDVYHGAFETIVGMCFKIAGIYPHDRPNSYDFEDEEEYDRKSLEYGVDHKMKIYEFMKGPAFSAKAI